MANPETFQKQAGSILCNLKSIPQETKKVDLDKFRNGYDRYQYRLPDNYQDKTFDNLEMTPQVLKIKNKLINEWRGEPVSLLSKLTGVGKTHIACACVKHYRMYIVDKWIDEHKDCEFGYSTLEDNQSEADRRFNNFIVKKAPLFINESKVYYQITSSYKSNNQDTEEGIVDYYSKYEGLLIIDDLFASRQTEFARGKMYDILNNRISYTSLPTIITSNFLLSEIGTQIDDRIASRLQGKFCFEITEGKDYRSL